MKGIIEGSGLIVKNKAEAIAEAKRYLDRLIEGGADINDELVYVMHYNEPDLIWFSVGYYDRPNITNYIKLDKPRDSGFYERLDAWKEKMHAKMEVA